MVESQDWSWFLFESLYLIEQCEPMQALHKSGDGQTSFSQVLDLQPAKPKTGLLLFLVELVKRKKETRTVRFAYLT